MLEELNELEKIGLAFISGLVAGRSLEEANEEVENEEKGKEKNNTIKITAGKIDGEHAKKFMEMMKELGVE